MTEAGELLDRAETEPTIELTSPATRFVSLQELYDMVLAEKGVTAAAEFESMSMDRIYPTNPAPLLEFFSSRTDVISIQTVERLKDQTLL